MKYVSSAAPFKMSCTCLYFGVRMYFILRHVDEFKHEKLNVVLLGTFE